MFPPSYVALLGSKACHRLGSESVSWCLETSLFFKTPFLGRKEKAMAPHSSTLAWKIPWTEKPGRLQSMGSLRVGHDWVTSLSLFTFMHWRRKWQPTPVFLPGESQGRRSLIGCSPWGRWGSDTTERLHFHFSWDGASSLPLLSLFLSFVFSPTSFQRQWASFLGAWCPLPAFRSCFVEFTRRSNVLLMNLWGRKWSPSLNPLPS